MKSEDALYDEAYLFVVEQQKASTSLLQRQFRIGYNRASRLMDDLERNQVIGPKGEMLVAVPHQDVLIIADIRNKTGYDVMAHLTMEFFTKGLVPITSLSFGYKQGHLEPI
ncbi:DUF1444 family protein, partial [Staphylococcus aureus]|nr:DUF1444 family protein [Staphylococcus aureus]